MIERSRVLTPAGTDGEYSSPGSIFCADSYFGIRSTPSVTAVARKRSRPFCLKGRWQVIAKHACTLRTWLCMELHGAWLYGAHRTCAQTAAVSHGTSRVSAVSTPHRCMFKKALLKAIHSCIYVVSYASAVSLLESGE